MKKVLSCEVRYNQNVKNIIVEMFLKIWLFLEKLGVEMINVPDISPDKNTLKVFETLKKVYREAENHGIKVWVTGSWAITGRNNGKFIKQIDDIDLTMRERNEERERHQINV